MLQFPTTENQWKNIANDFHIKWQFPHCLGAMDGKHVQIVPPAESGSFYYNYKQTHSVVLMAIANANYEFILCDVGTNGRISDGGVIENTNFYQKLIDGSLNIPIAEKGPNTNKILNYVFIGDEAFSLRPDLLKPFNQRDLTNNEHRIFNYRLSRARRIIENTFGILASRFRIFHTKINLNVKNIDIVVMAACTLHNFLHKRCTESYVPPGAYDIENIQDGTVQLGERTESSNLLDLQRGQNRQSTNDAKAVRQMYINYFNNEGAIPWQWNL